VPSAVLISSLGDSVKNLIQDVQGNTLQIPAPRPEVAQWPLVGEKLYAAWGQAHADLPALVQSLQPKVGELAKEALSMVASIGGGILQFVAALVIAGIIMAFGEAGDRTSRAIFERLASKEHGAEFAHLATTTIRAVKPWFTRCCSASQEWRTTFSSR
jgi:predicted PurR-regulated permease PerM